MEILNISAPDKKVTGQVNLPASKSISNRALIIQHLCPDKINLKNLSQSDDTQLMRQSLDKISNSFESDKPVMINCDNAGTVFRFLTAVLSNTPGTWDMRGSNRMYLRPIGPLVNALLELGAEIIYTGKEGYPPLLITGKLLKGSKITADGSISSQFISALLMIGPLLENGLQLKLENKINSMPYIQMTLGLLEYFGIEHTLENNVIAVSQSPYHTADLEIEPDWSSASFWYELVALAESSDVLLKGLSKQSLQGDAVLPEVFEPLGVKTVFEDQGVHLLKTGKVAENFIFNFSNNPDIALPVIVICAALGINGTFKGLENLRFKESDRLSGLITELTGLGFHVDRIQDSEIRTQPHKSDKLKSASASKKNDKSTTQQHIIETYGDHRMVMAFAPLAYLFGSLTLKNPKVVSKSYPDFWKHLQNAAGFRINLK